MPSLPLGICEFHPVAVRKLLVSLRASSSFGVFRESGRARGDAKAGGPLQLRRSLACSRAVRFARPNGRACL